MSGLHHVVQPFSNKTIEKSDNTCSLSTSADVLRERNYGLDNVLKVTILNFSHEGVDPENKACDRNEGCKTYLARQDVILRKKWSNFLLVNCVCQYCHGSMEMGPSIALFSRDSDVAFLE